MKLSRIPLESRFKCDTEVDGKCLDGCSVAEALPRRGVEVPDDVIEVGIGVPVEAGLAGRVAPELAVGVSIEPRCHGLCGSQK